MVELIFSPFGYIFFHSSCLIPLVFGLNMMCFAWTKLIFFDFLLGKKSNGLSLRNSTKLALRDVLLGVSPPPFFFFFFFSGFLE